MNQEQLDCLLDYANHCNKAGTICPIHGDVLIKLVEALKEAQQDAERYRWLRDESRHMMGDAPLAFMTNHEGEPIAVSECGMVLHDGFLDSAIDEAMRAS